MKLLISRRIQLLIIVILTFLAYSNIFANDFAIDDGDFVFNWPAIGDFGNLGRILTIESVPEDHAGVYRPVKAVFMMVWKAVFGVHPLGYHLFSLAVHLASTVLVYLIVRKICADLLRISADKKGRGVGIVTYLPFVTGLLFGLHPVHTEAVTFILASFDTLGLTFYFAAFYFYVTAGGTITTDRLRITADKKRWLMIASVGLAGLAFFTYELTLTLPLMLILADYALIRKRRDSALRSSSSETRLRAYSADSRLHSRSGVKASPGEHSGSVSWQKYWPYFAVLAIYLFIRFSVLDLAGRGEYLPAGEAGLAGSFSVTLLVMARAIVKYLEILIWPLNLSIDHEVLPGVFSVVYKDYLNIEFLKSLTIFSPVIFVCTLIIAALVIFSLKVRRKWPVVSFSILWFFVTLLPVSFIFPQSSIMAERYAYLASFGFTLVLSYLGYLSYLRKRGLILVILVVVVSVYGLRTYARNFDWKDTLTVWTVLAYQSPSNPVANYTLAKIYAERGNDELAIVYFGKALATHPNIAEVNFRLGKIYYSQGKYDLAKGYFEKSLNEGNARYFFQAKRELGKIEFIKQQRDKETKRQSVKREGRWVKYRLESKITFEYLDSWMVTEFDRGVSFDDLTESFSIEIIADQKDSQESFESYLLRQPDHFGKLVGEGWANVPNVSRAYVKVLKDEEVDKLEFFLNEKDVVLKILVYPSNSAKMKDFDRLLGSIRMDNTNLNE